MNKEEIVEKFLEEQMWKNKDQRYLFEIQKFLDLADNIEDEKLKKILIVQMIKCDKILTIIAEEKFRELTQNNNNF